MDEDTKPGDVTPDTPKTETKPDPKPDTTPAARTFTADEVEARIKAALDERERKEKDKELRESGKYKELYEKAINEANQARADAKAERIAALKERVARKHNLPDAFASVLVGDNEATLEAHAKELLKAAQSLTPTEPIPGTPAGDRARGGAGPSEDDRRAALLMTGDYYGI